MVGLNPVVWTHREIGPPSHLHGRCAVHPIPHRVYEQMVRRHQPREGFYVVTVDGCHKLLESLSSVNCSESIGDRPILSQRIPGYRGYSCALCIAGVEKGLARPCVQEANPSRRYKL